MNGRGGSLSKEACETLSFMSGDCVDRQSLLGHLGERHQVFDQAMKLTTIKFMNE
jgi:hypothetical protein